MEESTPRKTPDLRVVHSEASGRGATAEEDMERLRDIRKRRMQKLSVRTTYKLLALAEAACLALSFVAAGHLVGIPPREEVLPLQLGIFAVVPLLAMFSLGLYNIRQRQEMSEILARIFISFMLAALALAGLFYFLPSLQTPPSLVLVALSFSFALSVAVRLIYSRVCDGNLLQRKVLVIGSGERAGYIEERLRRNADRRGFQIVGYVPVTGDQRRIPEEKLLAIEPSRLETWVAENEVDEIVIAPDQRRGNLPMQALYNCRINGVEVCEIASFVEKECQKIPLRLFDPSWVIYGSGFQNSHYLTRVAKRGFDIGVSLLLLAVIWPVMVLTALLILLESGPTAPVFYSQKRVGRGNRSFWIYKFRSMQVDAEKNGAKWADRNDPRVTVVGAFIRRYRIDELPQIFNVLKGDMSFVGPRPERPEFVKDLARKIPYYEDRHQVKPGLTGWAQICYPYGASDHDAMEKLQYDLYYIKHCNILFDTMILIQTVEAVLFGKGVR